MPESPFEFDRPEDSPGFLLWQTTVTWQQLIKKTLDSYELSHAQFVIMALLLWFEEVYENLPQAALARYSKLDKMTVSQSLKKLAERRYVKRAESAMDTRAKIVTLTQQGKALARDLVSQIEKIDEEFFGVIERSQQIIFKNILEELILKVKE